MVVEKFDRLIPEPKNMLKISTVPEIEKNKRKMNLFFDMIFMKNMAISIFKQRKRCSYYSLIDLNI